MSLRKAVRSSEHEVRAKACAEEKLGFRVPGLSSAEESSASSSDEGSPHSSGDMPWRHRRKRHRPASYIGPREDAASTSAAAMETEHPARSPLARAARRAPNTVWASVLTDSVLDDAMSAHMRMYRSDRDVEAYAYPEVSSRRRQARAECPKAGLEEGELSEDFAEADEGAGDEEENEEEEEEEGGCDSHSDSLSIDNNVDPGEFAREGPRGRFDMEDVEAMDTNSRSALPASCSQGIFGEQESASVFPGAASRKRPRKKKTGRRGSVRSRLGKRAFDPEKPRPAFELSAERSDEEIAAAIAGRLSESRHDLILRCVRLMGREKTYHLLLLTEDVEEAGGLYTADGSRRRTPGGVFFHLLREDDQIANEKKRQIFAPTEEEQEYRKEKRRRKRINAGRRMQQRQEVSGVLPLDDWSSASTPFPIVGAPPPLGVCGVLSGLTPPHASTTSSSPPSSTLASTEAASSGKTPNNSPRPAPLEVDDF